MSNLNATELRTACVNYPDFCNISSTFPLITNHGDFTIKSTDDTHPTIYFGKGSDTDLFINYGTITTYYNEKITTNTFTFTDGPGFKALINYGTLSGGVNANASNINITNYGKMGGASTKGTVTIANYGEINLLNGNGKKYHFKDIKSLTLQNYAMKIDKGAGVFNAFDGQNASDNSHLILESVTSVNFADKNSKVILDFGSGFEFGAGYKLDKLIVKADNGETALSVDFDRLMPKSDIYTLYKQGNYFIAQVFPKHSIISNISKSNIRTMNNFYTLSNSMIYPRKVYHSQNLGRTHSLLQYSPSLSTSGASGWVEYPSLRDSAISLKSYESFAYRNESVNRRIQRQNKRNYSRTKRNNNSVILSESEESQKKNNRDSSPKAQNDDVRKSQTQRFSQNLSQNLNYSKTPHDYYFILTPFVNHNLFFESGRYNLSGLEYGFLTAFSGKLTPSNSLGTHFMMSYGNIGDSKDKDLSIKSLNLNLGINYKLDLIYDMYLKARGDFYYFSNALDSLTIKNIKPNNLGFGASASYGKDFNFGKGGMLGIEVGLDYKVLKTNELSLNSQTYKQSLLNLIYADVGMNYNKYFGGFGINLGTGFKANLAPKLAESALLINTQNLTFTLDNDKYLAYANVGISYLLNTKNFDMEFSLAYYGNFGDRIISNGGGVEWRVLW